MVKGNLALDLLTGVHRGIEVRGVFVEKSGSGSAHVQIKVGSPRQVRALATALGAEVSVADDESMAGYAYRSTGFWWEVPGLRVRVSASECALPGESLPELDVEAVAA